MDYARHFSSSYAQARERFLAAASQAGACVTSFEHPLRGRDGEVLAADVARLGPEGARHALVLASATHGVEGLCGSGIQCALLESEFHRTLGDDVALILVHAHNPHGFSWLRRTNEDNVDLNRNGRDFGAPIEPNDAYDEVHDWIVPSDWEGPAWQAAQRSIDTFIAERGAAAWQAAVTGGQHSHSDGVFYGGTEATWSHRTIREICRTQLAGFEHVGVLDLHTGLGPRGHGELIYARTPDDAEHRRLKTWLGDDVTSVLDGVCASAPIVGAIDALYREELGDGHLTFAVVEYGTVPIESVLGAVRLDNWVNVHDQVDSELGRRATREMLIAFVGDEPAWRHSVFERAQTCAARMAAGLSALGAS